MGIASVLDLDDAQFWHWAEAKDLMRKHGPGLVASLPDRERAKVRRWLDRDRGIIEQAERKRRGGLRVVRKK